MSIIRKIQTHTHIHTQQNYYGEAITGNVKRISTVVTLNEVFFFLMLSSSHSMFEWLQQTVFLVQFNLAWGSKRKKKQEN